MSKNDLITLADYEVGCIDLLDNLVTKQKPQTYARKKRLICSTKYEKQIEALEEIEEKLQNHFNGVLTNIWTNLVNPKNHAYLLYQAGLELKEKIVASSFNAYLVQDDKLVQYETCPTGGLEPTRTSEINRVTIAGSVADRKMSMFIDDTNRYKDYLESFQVTTNNLKSILCIPICDPMEICLGVLEFFRFENATPFTTDDRAYLVVNAGWIGAAMHQSMCNQELLHKEEIKRKLMNLIYRYFTGELTAYVALQEVGMFLKEFTKAKKLSLYVLDKTPKGSIVLNLGEAYCADHTELIKKNLALQMSEIPKILAYAFQTGERIVVTSSTDPRFGDHDRHQFGTYIKNLAMLPLKIKGETRGIFVLMNKEVKGLSEKEQKFFDNVSGYLSLCLLHWLKDRKHTHKLLSIKEAKIMYNKNISPCSHERKLEMEKLEGFKIPDDFNSLTWYITPGYYSLMPQMILHMMNEVMGPNLLDPECVVKFILKVRSSYRDVPFHNFEHAFNTCHCMYNIVQNNQDVFTDLERCSLLIASLCHDADHPGLTNNFLVMVKNRIAVLYDDESPLENHHYYVTMAILEESKLFKVCDAKTFKEMSNEIEKTIAATDLSVHFRIRNESYQIMFENFNKNDRKHKDYLKAYVVTGCDLSGNCKNFGIVKRLTDNLLSEFYKEGDIQKEMKVKPLSLMDRDQYDYVPIDQMHFLDVVVLPCLEVLSAVLPNTDDLLQETIKNRQKWSEIGEKGIEYWRFLSKSSRFINKDSEIRRESVFTPMDGESGF